MQSTEEILTSVPGAILHLVDKHRSVELASGNFSVIRLCQADHVVAIIAKVSDKVQWPLIKDEAAVKLDHSHYFFSFREISGEMNGLLLNYGLTFASGEHQSLSEVDQILERYSCFSVQKVKKGVVDDKAEKNCEVYWTMLAPNVEDYSTSAAKLITEGSGHLIKGILWCGDVSVDRLNWGNAILSKRIGPRSEAEISPKTLERIQRVKRVTKMTEEVAFGVLSRTVTVSGFFTSSIANSKLGRTFFGLLPGQIVIASLDGFNKVCDAVEVAGKNVMSTSSTVTIGLVSQKYGEEASKATNEVLDAAGNVIRTVWAVFQIKSSLNPKSVMKPARIIKKISKL